MPIVWSSIVVKEFFLHHIIITKLKLDSLHHAQSVKPFDLTSCRSQIKRFKGNGERDGILLSQ
jgi:hypothetical protein